MDIFEQASRLKLRYNAPNGLLNTEDLWGVGLATLDAMAVKLQDELQSQSRSFISEVRDTVADKRKQLEFDVVKRVIDVKLAERDAAKLKREKAEQRQKLLAALAEQQDAELKAMGKDDILKALAALDE